MDKETIENWLKENLDTVPISQEDNYSNKESIISIDEINNSIKKLQENFDLREVKLREVTSGKKFLTVSRKALRREILDWTLSSYLEKQTYVNQEIIFQLEHLLKFLKHLESNPDSKYDELQSKITQEQEALKISINLQEQKTEKLIDSINLQEQKTEKLIDSIIVEKNKKMLDIESSLKELYLDILDRNIDSKSLDYYCSEILGDRLSLFHIRSILKNSEEYQDLLENQEVLQKYRSKIKKPIFVFGVPRTGTTLLQSILCSNENLAWFSDQDIGDWLTLEEQHQHESFSQWLKSTNKRIPAAEQTLFALGKDLGPGIKHLGIPPKGSSKIPIEGEIFWKKYLGWAYIKDIPTETKILLAKEISQTIKKQRKERFINKAPNNSMRLFVLVTLFPDAKFINVARDPREVISSMITRYEDEGIFSPGIPIKNKVKYLGLELIEQFAWLYKEITEEIHQFSKEYKDNFMTVRYEELISNPNKIVKEMFEFAELEIPENISEFIPELYDTSQKWKKKISPEDEKKIFNILEESMKNMGYPYCL